jgi:hypothetical protein
MSTLQAAAARLANIRRALSGEPGLARRQELLDELRDVSALLEASGRVRLATEALAERVAKLEVQLRDRDPAERAAIIRERLGLSRSRYYELRQIVRNSPDCDLI